LLKCVEVARGSPYNYSCKETRHCDEARHAGETLEEARENLLDAVALLLETNREAAERKLVGRSVIREPLRVTA